MKLLFLMITIFMFSCEYQELSAYGSDNSEKVEIINKKFEKYRQKFPEVVNLSPKELSQLDDFILLDAREKKEYEVSIIKDAITLEEFEANKSKFKNSKLVVYCTIGYRSGLYTSELLDDGFNAYNLKGGVLLWSHEGFDFYKNNKKTNRVHIYSKDWNYLRDNYVGVF